MPSIVPPPLQADVEYYYHHLSRLAFIAIFISFLPLKHRITTCRVLPIILNLKIALAPIFTFHNSQLFPESPSITHFESM
ncbi:hypothetical protein A2U01_0050357, partial [Trifolium medium]|nr:hypothetical protein [Trifolium medium]